MDLKGSWANWAQATLGLSAKNNGVDYDLKQCSGIKYRYKGAKHRFPGIDFRTASENNNWDWVIYNDDTELYYDNNGSLEYSGTWGTLKTSIKEFLWTIRPWNDYDIGVNRNYGSLQISDIVCIGSLDLSSVFGISGPKSMALQTGYAATSTGIFTIRGEPEIELECDNCDNKIEWNGVTKKLDIAAGLPVGTYTVTLTATNSEGTKEHVFTLTVSASTPIITAAPKANTLKAWVQNGAQLHIAWPQNSAPLQLRIYNLRGNEVMTRTVTPNETISVSHLPKGVYVVKAGGMAVKVVK